MTAKKRKNRQPSKVTKSKVTLKEGELFQRHLELLNIRLIDIHSNIEIKDQALPAASTSKYEITASVGQSSDGHLNVNTVFSLESRPAEGGEESSRLRIRIIFQCVFKIIDATPDQLKEHVGSIVKTGMMIMWPHCRETVMSITGKMGLPQIILPMYAPTSLSEAPPRVAADNGSE